MTLAGGGGAVGIHPGAPGESVPKACCVLKAVWRSTEGHAVEKQGPPLGNTC